MLALFPARQRPHIDVVATDEEFRQQLPRFRTPDAVFEAQGDAHGDIDLRLVEKIESYLSPHLGQWEESDGWWHQMDYYGDGIRSLMFRAADFQPQFVVALHGLLKDEHKDFCIVCRLHESLKGDEDSKLGSIAICAEKILVSRRVAQLLTVHA